MFVAVGDLAILPTSLILRRKALFEESQAVAGLSASCIVLNAGNGFGD
jgi:hypothetical protein